MVRVRITNPTCAKRNYTWIPKGLCLEPGESKVFNFDPFVTCRNGVQLNLLHRDVKLGFVKLTYTVDAPCEVVPIEHLYDNVTTTQQTVPEVYSEPKHDDQIRATLDVVKDDEHESIPMIPHEDLSEAVKTTPVDIFKDSELVDIDELKVTAPDVVETVNSEIVTSSPKKRSRAKKVQA